MPSTDWMQWTRAIWRPHSEKHWRAQNRWRCRVHISFLRPKWDNSVIAAPPPPQNWHDFFQMGEIMQLLSRSVAGASQYQWSQTFSQRWSGSYTEPVKVTKLLHDFSRMGASGGRGSPRRLFLSPIGTCQTRQLLWIRTETFLLVICQWNHLSIFRRKKKKLSWWSRGLRIRSTRSQPEKWPWIQPRWFIARRKILHPHHHHHQYHPPLVVTSFTLCLLLPFTDCCIVQFTRM